MYEAVAYVSLSLQQGETRSLLILDACLFIFHLFFFPLCLIWPQQESVKDSLTSYLNSQFCNSISSWKLLALKNDGGNSVSNLYSNSTLAHSYSVTGVNTHTLRPQELAQDGLPFTERGGRAQGVKGEIFTPAWCPVSTPGPEGSLSSHWMFPYLTSPGK